MTMVYCYLLEITVVVLVAVGTVLTRTNIDLVTTLVTRGAWDQGKACYSNFGQIPVLDIELADTTGL